MAKLIYSSGSTHDINKQKYDEEKNTYKKKIEKLRDEFDSMSKNVSDKKQEFIDLENKISSIRMENSTKKDEVNELDVKKNNLIEDINLLKRKLSHIETGYKEHVKAFNDYISSNKILMNKLEKQKSDCFSNIENNKKTILYQEGVIKENNDTIKSLLYIKGKIESDNNVIANDLKKSLETIKTADKIKQEQKNELAVLEERERRIGIRERSLIRKYNNKLNIKIKKI